MPTTCTNSDAPKGIVATSSKTETIPSELRQVDAATIKDVITLQFNVIAFSKPQTKLYVCGAHVALGSWQESSCPRMTRVSPVEWKSGYSILPSCYTVDVNVKLSEVKEGLQFKFIRDHDGVVSWENGINSEHGNRVVVFSPDKQSIPNNDHLHMHLILGPNNKFGNLLRICPTQFQVSQEVSEYIQTTSYYRTVQGKNDMDYNIVDQHIILGSSPRTPEQLKHLKDIGVHTVVNLQTEEDVIKNGPCHIYQEGDENNSQTYRKAVKDAGLNLIWQPTTDMCTEGRAGMVACAAWLMGGALEQHKDDPNNKLYVHCNAGVGRSTAATMAYLCYLLDNTPEQAHLIVSSARPVVFFDKEAIMRGQTEFEKMFGHAKKSLTFLE